MATYSLAITELPSEIQSQFRSKVPLESILLCRTVCKKWNNLILEPSFAKLHRSVSPFAIMFAHYCYNEQHATFGFVTEKEDHTSSTGFSCNLSVLDMVIPDKSPVTLIGSCNRLLCLSSSTDIDIDDEVHENYADDEDDEVYENYADDEDDEVYENYAGDEADEVYENYADDEDYSSKTKSMERGGFLQVLLCNPISGYRFTLPDPPKSNGLFGFGYVPSTGQYKAVKMVFKEEQRQLLFHVCAVQSGDCKKKIPPSASPWRTIYHDDSNGILSVLRGYFWHPAFFKGSVIWIAKSTNFAEGRFLVYFDIENEQSQVISLPPNIFRDTSRNNPLVFRYVAGIGVYYDDDGEEHLYLCEEFYLSHVNIWVMEDFKCTDSLKLKWTIELQHPLAGPIELFKVHKDGKLLIRTDKWKLAYYDPNTGITEIMRSLQLPLSSGVAIDVPNLLGCML